MASTNIFIVPLNGNNTVTEIHFGTSTPKLGGKVDISAFPNLQQITCNNNGITSFIGYADKNNLIILEFYRNEVTGSIPSLSGLNNLTTFRCYINQLTGSIPSLSGLNNLTIFECFDNQLTGPIPSLSGLNNLTTFRCSRNQLTGSIPSLSGLNNLVTFSFDANQLTGPIPSLSGLNNLVTFNCNQNQLTGPIPSLSGLNNLGTFICNQNQLTGPIPSLNGLTNLITVNFDSNQLTGSIPSLSGLNNLATFRSNANQLTGPIPSLNGLTNLTLFSSSTNQLTGSIPSLSGLNNLVAFNCSQNQLTGFNGGPVFNTLGNFQVVNNQLTSTSVDAILSAFVVANRTTGQRLLSLGGTGNAAPSYTGGVTTTSPGNNFTRSGTLVTANVTGHGHVTGNIVTITDITPTAFQGTFAVTRITDNQFRYTTLSSGTATGAGTATMRRTTNPSDGYTSYQNLALVSRTGGPWSVTINQP